MDYFFKSLLLEDEKFESYNFDNEEKIISNLSKLNIIVGPNNSGKSRFLRKILGSKNYTFTPTFLDMRKINESLKKLSSDISIIKEKYNITNVGNKSNFDFLLSLKNLSGISSPEDSLKNLKNTIINLKGNNGPVESLSNPNVHSFNTIYNDLRNSMEKFEKTSYGLLDESTILTFKKVYIPTLRGLRPFDEISKNYYEERTLKDYESLQSNEIFTGQDLYLKIRSLLLGDLSKRKIISDYQEFLGNEFFSNEEVSIIPLENSDVLNIKIGSEKEQPIYNLGDGIQSIIIITFPLFLYRNENLLLFIEEPELYLHPGLQRKLIEILTEDSSSFDKTQVFLTTHSNHFLDITFDFSKISIYKCQKNKNEKSSKEHLPTFSIDNLKNEDSSILENLGVQNSSVYLSNCTIWVEGITDRMYIKKYLDVYLRENKPELLYKEDYHYSFIEYSGNNITHWSFLENEDDKESKIKFDRISHKIFLITDFDSDVKKERHKKLTEKLGDSYYCLESKEIENTLSEKVLEKVIREYEKDDEGDIFKKEIIIDDYKKASIGSYIEDLLVERKRVGSYSSDSGTITDKLNFCKKSLKYINDVEDLSEEGKELCKRLVNFIKESNS